MNIEIDTEGGFCFGVTRAISMAEEELAKGHTLHCLGDIVHNGKECERLATLGLRTINHRQLQRLNSAKVLLRAHGEPPQTYETARRNGNDILDATCPVVLQLQKRIRAEYEQDTLHSRQIVIFGTRGHAEVLGLVGQTQGQAIVIESPQEALALNFARDISLYSQTTKSLDVYHAIAGLIRQRISPQATFRCHDTICRQVSGRMAGIRRFAREHDAVLFVCGPKSSNGQALYGECKRANPRTHIVGEPSDISPDWLQGCQSVGICGATSTPKWLMEQCRAHIRQSLRL